MRMRQSKLSRIAKPTATSPANAHTSASESTMSFGIGAYGVGGANLFQTLSHTRGSFNGFALNLKNSMPYSAHAHYDFDAAPVVYFVFM